MGTPLEIRRQADNTRGEQIPMEQAFIDIVEHARQQREDHASPHPSAVTAVNEGTP
jgi:hypothetical protein